MSGQFSCFGLSILGTCLYNPAQPSPTYFTVGDAIAALGFTLAIQQLFRPIYRFRLRAYGLKVVYLSGVAFAGVLCTMIALILPNLPISHATFFEYPISWELLGGLLIAAAYGVTAFISLRPASINRFNLIAFVRAASALLSSANDDDRVAFAEDFLAEDGPGVRNIKRLASYASALERASRHALFARSERRQSAGRPVLMRGRPMVSPFYEFAHRRELEAARFAVTFLRILSDPDFCSALVRKCAWRTAAILEAIARGNIDIDQATPFIQEIAHQAILNEESIIAKEVSYTGFGTVPLLSNSLFGNWFILSQYDPMGGIGFRAPDNLSAGFVGRLNGASKLMLETAIKKGDYWPSRYMYSVQRIYESLSRQWGYARGSASVGYRVAFHRGISELCRILADDLSTMKWEIKKPLFVMDSKSNRRDLVDVIASIVYEGLANVANGFNGFEDDAWTFVIDIFMEIYPNHEGEPSGMSPLQQQLALQLIDNLRHNMDGFYPAISRVLLAVIGPYAGHPQVANRSAFVILKHAVYKELQKLPDLHAKNPERIADKLPPSVAYDPITNTLAFVCRRGEPAVTKLSDLDIPDIDLFNESNWQTLSITEEPAASER